MIAVVGAGRMGSVHLRALGETRLARLAAVVEPVAESRERVAERYPACPRSRDSMSWSRAAWRRES